MKFQSKIDIHQKQDAFDGYFKIIRYKLQFQMFNGRMSHPIYREVFERGDAVGIILYNPESDSVVLIEQFRAGCIGKLTNPWLIEIAAGIIGPHETIEEVAKRESIEETGATIKKLIPIYDYFASPGGSSERVYLFCGIVEETSIEGIKGLAEESEDIRVFTVSTKQAFQMLDDNKINNALTIIALQWLRTSRETLINNI